MRFINILFLMLALGAAACARGERFIWAHGATHFGHECPPPSVSCRLARVVSPNRRYTFMASANRDSQTFQVVRGNQHYDVPGVGFLSEMEVLWSPDSSAFSLAWNLNGFMETTRIFTVDADGVHETALSAVQTDFVRKFPPCVDDRNPPCSIDPSGSDYNYLSVAWSSPHTVVIMAEVPPAGNFGANLGAVRGYEMDALSGRIVRIMRPIEFKRRWQSHMGWNFRLSETEGVNPKTGLAR